MSKKGSGTEEEMEITAEGEEKGTRIDMSLIMKKFDSVNLEQMRGYPKCFIVQACRLHRSICLSEHKQQTCQ